MDSAFSSSKERRSPEGAGRPRDQEARNAILRAALSLVKEFGYRSLTIDKIARRAKASASKCGQSLGPFEVHMETCCGHW